MSRYSLYFRGVIVIAHSKIFRVVTMHSLLLQLFIGRYVGFDVSLASLPPSYSLGIPFRNTAQIATGVRTCCIHIGWVIAQLSRQHCWGYNFVVDYTSITHRHVVFLSLHQTCIIKTALLHMTSQNRREVNTII